MGLSDLPDASGVQHEKVFHALGWVTRRSGNHIIMTHANVFGVTLSIPNHSVVKRTTLHGLVRAAGYKDGFYRQVFDSL